MNPGRRILLGLIGGALLAAFLGISLIAPTAAPFNPASPVGQPLSPPSLSHLLGTNDIGQDLFSQWLWGARASLVVGLLVTVISITLAWTVGLSAGTWRPTEGPLLGLADLILALPALPLLLLILSLFGPSRVTLVLTLGFLSWPAFARVVRAQILTLRRQPYVEAARALGATPLRVSLVHILPGTLVLLPSSLLFTVRYALLTEVTLAFLGLGDPAAKSWGTVLGTAFNYPLIFSRSAWTYWILPPALSIALLLLAITWVMIAVEGGLSPNVTGLSRSIGSSTRSRVLREDLTEARVN